MLRNIFIFALVLLPLSVVCVVLEQFGSGPIVDPITKLSTNGEILFLIGLLGCFVALALRHQAKRITQLEKQLAERG
ncbi:MAG: hypothetical protein HOL01_00775 [Planctomycetaceae bacterium]|jgi:hypothetical protein|nr:hypothetical protein [Planctomycetaceae bacterium]MBT6493058.1 hypothetical protein [Planctomycetaceae bacterium]